MKKLVFLGSVFLYGTIAFSQQPAGLRDSSIYCTFSSPTDSVYHTKAVNIYDTLGNKIYWELRFWNSELGVWDPYAYHESAYDVNGKETSDAEYTWDSNLNVWVGNHRYDYEYNISGIKTKVISSSWSSTQEDWSAYSQNEFVYDMNADLILENKYFWDQDFLVWRLLGRSDYSYDADGNNTLEVAYYRNSIQENWTGSYKYESAYDSQGNMSSHILYNWSSDLNDWVGREISEYSYDSFRNIIMRIDSDWDSDFDDWILSGKTENIYDSNGNWILWTKYDWDPDLSDWIKSFKHEFFYNSNGKKFLFSKLIWDPALNDWALENKYFFYYFRYQITENETSCEGDSILWQDNFYHTEGTYYAHYVSSTQRDSVYELNLTINPKPEPFNIAGQIEVDESQVELYFSSENSLVEYTWYTENGNILSIPSDNSAEVQWGYEGEGIIWCVAENQYNCRSDSSKLEVTIGETNGSDSQVSEMEIYPNPTGDFITIETYETHQTHISTLEIYSSKGILVYSEKFEGPRTIVDLTNFQTGSYIIKLYNEGFLDFKNIIKI